AFSQIAVVPTGSVGLTGISLGTTFLGGAAERLGVRMEGGARHEYKNAPNKFTETGYTEPHREVTERLVASRSGQVAAGDAQAREAGLVDRLAYRDEIYADLRGRYRAATGARRGGAAAGTDGAGAADTGGQKGPAGEGAKLMYVSRYRHRAAMSERMPGRTGG